jgi:hypothetical protein
MTITTANKNPKNDSLYARHRSTWKGQTNVLDSVYKSQRRAICNIPSRPLSRHSERGAPHVVGEFPRRKVASL